MTIKLALVDDCALFRKSVRTVLLELDSNIQITEHASVPSPDEVLALAEPFSEQLVLLDYHLPNTDFLKNLFATKACFPQASVVVVSADETAQQIIDAVGAGAAGYIPKSSSPEIFVAALRLVLLGQTYLPEQVMLLAPHKRLALRRAYARLSGAQKKVLQSVIAGKSNKVIAIDYGLSPSTIKNHLTAAYRTLGLRNRTEAVLALSTIDESSGASV